MKNSFYFRFFAFFLFVALALFFTACSEKSDTVNLIPEDAQIVMTLDLQSLGVKGKLQDLGELPSLSFLKDELKSEDPRVSEFFDKLMKDAKSTGIDFAQQAYIYGVVSEYSSGGVLLSLKDAGKFEAFLKEIYALEDETFEKSDKGKNSFVALSDMYCIGWNNSSALLSFFTDSESTENSIDKNAELMNPETVSPLTNNKQFKQFNAKKKDIGFWIDLGIYNEIQEFVPDVDVTMPYNFTDCYMDMCVNFEKDEVKTTVASYLSDEAKEWMKMYYAVGKDFNTKIIDVFSEKSLFLITSKFNPDIDMNDLMGMMKSQLESAGMSNDETEQLENILKEVDILLKEMGGSFVINLSDIENGIMPTPHASIAFDIKNSTTPRDYVKKLCVEHDDVIKEIDTHFEMELGLYTMYIYIDNNLGVVTLDHKVLENLVSGKSEKPNLTASPLGDKIKKYGNYGYLEMNLERYPSWVSPMLQSIPYASLAIDFLNYYDYVEFYSVNDYDGEMILKMKNVEHNSFYTYLLSIDAVITKALNF
ncbi:DUF4836 family protein [Bacteroidales bacterium OttesenSCG-928-B11]|nr:DUF4836 family protein [Bacteroidales bacterium OttesenSCG-928-E04]MDL2312487.1 DUF4836 family protein [Bacteroidales bacterium OttesenSCG-928-B11]MDL2325718.1 DUF4836 family protein [Bacteroidales bacterium OttesenSCG-928-A14]